MLHTLYLDSLAGYSLLHNQVQERQSSFSAALGESECATETFQNTCSISYMDVSGQSFEPVSMLPNMRQGDMKQRTEEDGPNSLRLGALCVVSLYSYWEEYLRIEIGKAMGVLLSDAKNDEATKDILNKHVKYDVWGDLRFFRHSILHANGVANSEFSRCKKITWFQPGDKIELTYEKVRKIFLLLASFRNELHSLSFPPRKGIRVPSV